MRLFRIVALLFTVGCSGGVGGGDGGAAGGGGGGGGGDNDPAVSDPDQDTISDLYEGAAAGVDTDLDGTVDALDPDSDGDGIPDAIEAGDADLATPPIDTDSDGTPNFRDLDSDDDGVPDQVEDPNGNGVLDPGESSPRSADTDGDGTPDIVERQAGTDPNSATSNIPAGDFYFVLPLGDPAVEATFSFTTRLRKADVLFSVDTTGSFDEEIANIQASLASILGGVRAQIPDAAFGVGKFGDFPLSPFGLAGDRPFKLLQRLTTDDARVSAAIDQLPPATGGNDKPEAGFEALYQWGAGLGLPAFGAAPFDWQVGYSATAGMGELGGAGFRADALPIVVQVTDARAHDAAEYPATFGAHGKTQALGALSRMGARIIGINSLENQGTADDPRAQLEDLAGATNALVPPTAGTCPTGVLVGATPSPRPTWGTSGKCALVFDVRTDGSGLGGRIVEAIRALATLSTIDISSRARGDQQAQAQGVDSARFIKAITPVPPAPAGATIVGDVFRGVTTGSTVTFKFQAQNDFVPPAATPRLFKLHLEVVGDGVTTLDERIVYVIVPPTISGIN
ncbi:MAG: hypothetical protein Q8L48_17635 [Archangium sp.]|nr:hypothetical protein [Archangium sp.]